MKIHQLSITLASALLLTLTGCGGGGGGGSSSSTSQYTVGGTVSGLSASDVVLQDNGDDDLSVASNNTFEFSTALDDGSNYAVSVKTQPTDKSCGLGNRSGTLSGADVTNVTVTCRSWGTEGSIGTTGNDVNTGYAPQIAANANGDAVAVWAQSNGSTDQIYAAYYTSGSGWGSKTLISDGSNASSAPHVAIDSSGNAWAVWVVNGNIVAKSYTAGGSWGTVATLDSSSNVATSPKIAIDSSGNALAVWTQPDSTNLRVYANRYTSGGSWGTAATIDNSTYAADSDVQLAIDNNGNALAVWTQSDGTNRRVYANHYTSGGSWGTATTIDSSTYAADIDPKIAINSSGNAVAVWTQSDGTYVNVYANRYNSGWGTATAIESSSYNADGDSLPQIAVDSSGNAVAVWEQADSLGYDLFANHYTVGSGWSSATTIASNSSPPPNNYDVAIDSDGNALAVWQLFTGVVTNVYANHYTAGSGWGTAATIESNSYNAIEPRIAIDGSGNALAVWVQNDGSSYKSIYANRYQ